MFKNKPIIIVILTLLLLSGAYILYQLVLRDALANRYYLEAKVLYEQSSITNQDREKIVNLSSKALYYKSTLIGALQIKHQTLIELKRYREALSVLNQIADTKGDVPEIIMGQGLLLEWTGAPAEQYLTCYNKAAELFARQGRTKDINYIVAMLFAKAPNAEKVKNDYLSGLKKGSSEDRLFGEALRNFNRQRLLADLVK